jgi:alkylation response protein AidB-like acyl-CoA dehydrogenase
MELEFTADQDELRDSVRTVLAKESPISLARTISEGDADGSRLWATTTGLGWPALTVPEALGGIGLGAVEAAILAEELGRVVAPGPLLATVTQFVPLLVQSGHANAEPFLAAVAAGETSGTIGIAEAAGSFDPDAVDATARRAGDGFELSGRKHWVVDADRVDEVAVVTRDADAPARDPDAVMVVVVPAVALERRAVTTLDATRSLVEITLDGVHVAADRVVATDAAGIRRALAEATVALGLEMVGIAQSIFDVTLEYAKQREQFGVPIGSFQAVKHAFADMAIALERARSTGYFAALTLAENDERWRTATSVAKIAAGDCQRLLAKQGIQLHGGIGYTWEHDMHLYVKRIKTGEALFGTSAWHRAALAEQLLRA